MRIHFVQHEIFESPGVLLIWAEKKGYRFIQKPDEIRKYNYTEMNEMLFQFLDKLVAEKKVLQ